MKSPSDTEFFTEWTDCESCGDLYDASLHSRHQSETELAHQLNALPDVEFQRLVVRRLPNDAICLEGTMRLADDEFDVEDYVKCLAGVKAVLNRLSVKRPHSCGEDTAFFGEDTVVS